LHFLLNQLDKGYLIEEETNLDGEKKKFKNEENSKQKKKEKKEYFVL
jgi:hypothetical protein